MSAYVVTRPRGLILNGGQVSCGATVTSEQIGNVRAERNLLGRGWIKEMTGPAPGPEPATAPLSMPQFQSTTAPKRQMAPTVRGRKKGKG